MGKILIVDDDQGTTKLLEFMLSKEGYDVASINDGGETLPTALAYSPNLILLDVMMPSKDGFEVCKDLRAKSQFAHTPIVFFTSVSDVDKKAAAFGSGANDYILKPIHPRELKLRIQALIGRPG
ncbi:MAG TPA: response regulator transcription factor [Anaerolineales bacterium]|nr:response regulator transcription factor [Anaerolineales bacterium]